MKKLFKKTLWFNLAFMLMINCVGIKETHASMPDCFKALGPLEADEGMSTEGLEFLIRGAGCTLGPYAALPACTQTGATVGSCLGALGIPIIIVGNTIYACCVAPRSKQPYSINNFPDLVPNGRTIPLF